MKVILLQDVSKVGKKHEVKDIADGYALNHLIPRSLAEPATAANIKKAEKMTAKRTSEKEQGEEAIRSFLATASQKGLTLTVGANDKGHLFKGVHADDIQKAASEQFGLELKSKSFELPEPIKEVGDWEVSISVGETKGNIMVHIKAK